GPPARLTSNCRETCVSVQKFLPRCEKKAIPHGCAKEKTSPFGRDGFLAPLAPVLGGEGLGVSGSGLFSPLTPTPSPPKRGRGERTRLNGDAVATAPAGSNSASTAQRRSPGWDRFRRTTCPWRPPSCRWPFAAF